MPDMYGLLDIPPTDPVIGGRDADGRSFMDVAREELIIEAETLRDLEDR